MSAHTTHDIRNIGLVGHVGSGKTTLAERLFYEAGVSHATGDVEQGNTVCDFEPEEKERGFSLTSAIASADVDGKRVNLVDTPGSPDFIGHALSVLPAVETVATVVNAQTGIETVTRRVLRWAADRGLCRALVVNKVDAENVDLPQLVRDIQQTFGKECLPINLPSNGHTSVVDVFNQREGVADFSSVAEAHTAIVDQVVEVDDALMEKYLEQGEVSPEQLHEPFEKALREGHLIPICFVSARTGVGVAELLKLFTDLMPSPLEGNPHPFFRGEGDAAETFHATPDPEEHAIGHVFKVTADPFVGRLGIFRVHQGTVTRDSQLYIGDARKPFRVGHLLSIQGKDHPEIERAIPGDIAAVGKVEEIQRDAVVHDSPDEAHIHLRPLPLPTPIAGPALEARSRGEEQKVARALTAMEAEDPCFRVERTEATNETVIRGLGELHLQVILEKIRNRYQVEMDTREPRIAYHETITRSAEGHHRHKKQTGGAGQFGEVYLRAEPLDRGAGFEFHNAIVGGAIPTQFIPAVQKGVEQIYAEGAVAGYPMQDIRVTVYDGKYHPVDSKEVAFVAAARHAFYDAIHAAHPVLLEPIVAMEIVAPESAMGDIAADLSSRRGRIQGTDTLPGDMLSIRAAAPLAELSHYEGQLKSITAGQGTFTMELSHYEAVPPHIQQQLVERARPKDAAG